MVYSVVWTSILLQTWWICIIIIFLIIANHNLQSEEYNFKAYRKPCSTGKCLAWKLTLTPSFFFFSIYITLYTQIAEHNVSPPLSAVRRRPAGSFQRSSPAWSTDRIQRCRSTQSRPSHCDLRSDPTDTPACPVPDCSTNRDNKNGQKLKFLARWLSGCVILKPVL